jgi:hypothetical protein
MSSLHDSNKSSSNERDELKTMNKITLMKNNRSNYTFNQAPNIPLTHKRLAISIDLFLGSVILEV